MLGPNSYSDLEVDASGASPLFQAAQAGNEPALEDFIKARADVNKLNMHGVSPFFIAVQEGRHKLLPALIHAKANLNQAASSGATPIMVATQRLAMAVAKH